MVEGPIKKSTLVTLRTAQPEGEEEPPSKHRVLESTGFEEDKEDIKEFNEFTTTPALIPNVAAAPCRKDGNEEVKELGNKMGVIEEPAMPKVMALKDRIKEKTKGLSIMIPNSGAARMEAERGTKGIQESATRKRE